MTLGASAEDWAHFDLVLGLGGNLLPCVPYAPDVKVAPNSQIAGKIGKIPSAFNSYHEAHGIGGWQRREITGAELAYWSLDRRLNLCVRTGPVSGVYAFDIDIDDERADNVNEDIDRALGECLPPRARDNSAKRLLVFRMDEPCTKRKIKLDDSPRGPAIELLGTGQQFVACGTHASGSRYRWLPELPSSIPKITSGQLNSIWTLLIQRYATTTPTREAPTAPDPVTTATATGAATRGQTTEVLTQIDDEGWSRLIESLRFLLDKVQDNDRWSEVGYALLSLQRSGRPAEQLWLDFSRKAVGYEPGAAEAWWQSHRAQEPRTDFRHILNLARRHGLQRVADPAEFEPVPEPEPNADLVGEDPRATAAGPSPILLEPARFSEILDQIETALAPHVFTQGAAVARTSEARDADHIQRSPAAVMLVPATREWARKRLGQLCLFLRPLKGGDMAQVAPPAEYVNAVLGLGGWKQLRPIDAIARAPFLREDGTICDAPGYDAASRTLYVPSAAFPPVPERPGRADAAAALDRLRRPFDQFPWKEPASEAAFVSHILAEAARLAMERCPMYFYDAPMAGTGKSTLQEMAARIVHGTEPALRPWVPDEDELRKSLYACLMSGDRSVWFDNVPDGIKVRSSVLEAFLTSAVWKDRKLGESVTTGIPNKVVLVASGNNLTPVAALARRSIVVRLDANTENLRERVFRIANPRRYVMERRPQLLVDALTIIKAYLAREGAFTAPVTLPSFEDWSRLAREPLLWLGMADPVVTQLTETDDEMRSAGPIFQRIAATFGGRTFTAADLARTVGSLSDENNELGDAMMQMGCAEPSNPTKVGYWLRASKDKIGGGLKLVHDGHSMRGVRWRLHSVGGELA